MICFLYGAAIPGEVSTAQLKAYLIFPSSEFQYFLVSNPKQSTPSPSFFLSPVSVVLSFFSARREGLSSLGRPNVSGYVVSRLFHRRFSPPSAAKKSAPKGSFTLVQIADLQWQFPLEAHKPTRFIELMRFRRRLTASRLLGESPRPKVPVRQGLCVSSLLFSPANRLVFFPLNHSLV